MERNYLPVGAEYTDTQSKKDAIAKAIGELEWIDLPANVVHGKNGAGTPTIGNITLPFSQGFALNQMIMQLGHNPDRIAHGILHDGVALLAMRNNYNEGEVRRATVYVLDFFDHLVPVASDRETEIHD